MLRRKWSRKRRDASHRAPVAQNGILGPENPKSVTSRSVTWRCLKLHVSTCRIPLHKIGGWIQLLLGIEKLQGLRKCQDLEILNKILSPECEMSIAKINLLENFFGIGLTTQGPRHKKQYPKMELLICSSEYYRRKVLHVLSNVVTFLRFVLIY